MKLFEILVRQSPNKVFTALSLGVFTGLGYAMLIPIILMSLEDKPFVTPGTKAATESVLFVEVANYKFAVFFFVTCIFITIMKTISQVLSSSVSLDATLKLRLDIYRKASRIPVAKLEEIGSSNLIAMLTNDVPRVISGAQAIPDAVITGITVVGVLGFLAFLDFMSFLFILGMILFLLFAYDYFLSYGQRFYQKSRHFVDELHFAIRALIMGSKELKLNNRKREAFFKEALLENEEHIKENEKKGFILMQSANNFGDMISFLMVGFAAFILINYRSIEQADLFGIIIVLIYFIGPLEGFLNCLPLISVAKISLERLNHLLNSMDNEEQDSADLEKPIWSKIKVNGLCYKYNNPNLDEHENFGVGPIDFEVKKGEVAFIAGGNGSGKSTLAKMFSLHYIPTGGSISFDEIKVTPDNINLYRQEISAIYTDYHLFEKVFGYDDESADEYLSQYLRKLELDKKVSINNGKFSTVSLSDGQKRRLALVVAFLEDNDFYIFDEWAADQDPTFKEVFYHTILADLKSRGKAVLVISHDDRFYDVADKVIYLDSGKISKVVCNSDE